MPRQIETAMAALFTALLAPSNDQNCPSLKQVLFRDHDHVASSQGDIAFEILAGLVGRIIEHVDGLIAAWTPAADLDAILRGIGTDTTRESNRLHQRRRLANDIRARPNYFACDENLRLE